MNQLKRLKRVSREDSSKKFFFDKENGIHRLDLSKTTSSMNSNYSNNQV